MGLSFVKKPILWLILFMSISLIGIVLVQFFWIKRAIEVQKSQITSDAYDVLHTSVMRLENEYRADSFLKMKGLNPNQVHHRQKNRHSRSQMARVPFNTQVYISQDGTFSATTQYSITDASVWEDKGLNGVPEPSDDNGIPSGQTTTSLDLASNEQQQQELLEWFTQMSNEFNRTVDPLKGRMNLEELEAILKDEFMQRGIDSPFEFGVVDKATLEVTPFHSSKFNPSEQHNSYVIPLFPNDVFRGFSSYYLQVNLFSVNSMIFNSLGWLMGASMIFTLFILVAFFLTVRTILSQKRVSEIKNDFINNMTHEFKTPIATISLATDSISNASIISQPERIAPLLSIIKEENKRMNKQVERILQMSLLEKQDFQLFKSQTNVNQLVVKVVDKMKLLAQQSGGEITTVLEAKIPEIWIDEVHFTNVIHNLIDNAIKYTANPPKIQISTKEVVKGIEIAVSDNGLGLSKEQQELIFEKFYRVHTGNQHNIKGFGLGLSYVKAIVGLHGGEIKISSKLGVGTTFYITIPINS